MQYGNVVSLTSSAALFNTEAATDSNDALLMYKYIMHSPYIKCILGSTHGTVLESAVTPMSL